MELDSGALAVDGFKFNAIHMALIPAGPLRGKVLAWDYGLPTDCQGHSTGTQRWSIIDPTRPPTDSDAFWNFFLTDIPTDPPGVPNGAKQDIACAGFAWLYDGKLLVAGGTQLYASDNCVVPPTPTHASGEIEGAKLAYVFNPFAWNPSQQGFDPNSLWQPQMPLNHTRYYPTVAAGTWPNVYVVRGHTDVANHQILNDYESWDQFAQGPFTPHPNGPPNPPAFVVNLVYPRMHLVSTRELFLSGFDAETESIVFPGNPWVGKGMSAPFFRYYGTSVLFPNIDAKHTDAVMIMGGEITLTPGSQTASVQICKASASSSGGFNDSPQGYDWTPVAPAAGSLPDMHYARSFLNTVLLPDATVLVIGGEGLGAVPVKKAELFKGGVWRELAEMATKRVYHQTALLLPSGNVLVAGGEGRPANGTDDYEVYVPPYACNPAARPAWEANWKPVPGSESVHYGVSYEARFTMPTGAALGKIVLMRPGAVTHHFDVDQRYRELALLPPLEGVPNSRYFVLPSSSDALPPGYYMAFLVTTTGIPSEAAWIKLEP